MNFSLLDILQIVGPACAVYAAIRADIAAMHIRLDHLERDLYKNLKPSTTERKS